MDLKRLKLAKECVGIINQLYDLAEVPTEKRQAINDKADKYLLDQVLRLCVVSKSFNSEEELLQLIYMHIPIGIKPKSKRAKGKLVSAFTSRNAFEQVCKHLAKKLFNV